MSTGSFVKVADVSELPPGTMKMVEVGREQILLANVDGSIYACANVCTHAGGSLAEGELNGLEVECPRHRSVFNISSGEVVQPPANENLRTFDVRTEGLDIMVRL